MTTTLPAPATITRNILKVYRRATEQQRVDGAAWYAKANSIAASIANGDAWLGAGLLSAYSPMTPWWRNVELAVDSFRTGVARTDTLTNNARAAARMLAGEPVLDVLNGQKTRAFVENIATCGETDAVTVDSHAYSVAINKHTFTKDVKLGKRDYRIIAEAYRRAAKREGLDYPSHMQAIVWCVWREENPNRAAQKDSRAWEAIPSLV